MSPCHPSRLGHECPACRRYRPEPMTAESLRRILIIDASTITKPGQACPMRENK